MSTSVGAHGITVGVTRRRSHAVAANAGEGEGFPLRSEKNTTFKAICRRIIFFRASFFSDCSHPPELVQLLLMQLLYLLPTLH